MHCNVQYLFDNWADPVVPSPSTKELHAITTYCQASCDDLYTNDYIRTRAPQKIVASGSPANVGKKILFL